MAMPAPAITHCTARSAIRLTLMKVLPSHDDVGAFSGSVVNVPPSWRIDRDRARLFHDLEYRGVRRVSGLPAGRRADTLSPGDHER
ncbi:hypothetical protein GCM10022224_007690 [Nonomuraea antimicrobica]|uniref:Uncharacterized protein n=1 Tax=Nonomuraea antimicrobica TaxID=561173 RepID=A0ABP7B3U1_9ACTN